MPATVFFYIHPSRGADFVPNDRWYIEACLGNDVWDFGPHNDRKAAFDAVEEYAAEEFPGQPFHISVDE